MNKILRIKKAFKQRLNEIENIKATNMAKKVFLVDKPFYDDFIIWLKNRKTKRPKNLNIENLYSGDKVKPDLKRGVDYEIIDNNFWTDFKEIYDQAHKIEAILVKNPQNGEETVLTNFLNFSIYIPRKVASTDKYSISNLPIEYYSHSKWILKDVKNNICEKYNLDKNSFSFTMHNPINMNDRIDETFQMGQVICFYKNELDLRQNKLAQSHENSMKNLTAVKSVQMHKNPSANVTLRTNKTVKSDKNKKVGSTATSLNKTKNTEQQKTAKTGYKSSMTIDEKKHSQQEQVDSKNDNLIRKVSSSSKTTKTAATKIAEKENFYTSSSCPSSTSSSMQNDEEQHPQQKQIESKSRNVLLSLKPTRSATTINKMKNADNENFFTSTSSSNPFDEDKVESKAKPTMNQTRNIQQAAVKSTSIYDKRNTQLKQYESTKVLSSSKATVKINERVTSLYPRPVGLNNLGNTCFFNAAVQCLARVMPLTRFILSDSFSKQLNPSNSKSSRGAIAHSYRRFLEDLCKGSIAARDPSDLRRSIVSFYRRFANYGQHDSQELLCSLLDGLHEDMNQSSKAGGRLSPVKVTSSSDGWEIHISRNASPIVDIFHGILYSSVSCPSCGYVSKVLDPFVFLSLEIPRRFSAIKLESCLEKFSQKEVLDARNKWRCEKCKKLVCATKEMGVERCGRNALIIHLKRFSGEGYFASKIDTPVDYPDVLDAASFAKNDSGKFKLIGAVFHSGGLGGGHYTAAAIDPQSKEWYNFNDSMARRIDRSGAHSRGAYILFYLRQE